MISSAGIQQCSQKMAALLFPRRCPFCGRVLGYVAVCSHCAPELNRLRRAVPRLSPGDHCLDNLVGAASLYQYKGCVRNAVLRMKGRGNLWYAHEIGIQIACMFSCTFRWEHGILIQETAPAVQMYDMVIPVPPSRPDRSDTLSARLAVTLALCLGVPVERGYLYKQRMTEKQAGKSAAERMKNVKDAYGVHQPQQIEGKRILLVDDVITTGATLSNCAKALCKAGALEIFAVTFAQTSLV